MAESPEEVAVLVQRVVKDINSAFKRNPDIDEIGLIPCPEARYNRSPIVLVENKLGVESWCVKFLLPYVHNKLLHYKLRKQWLNKEVLHWTHFSRAEDNTDDRILGHSIVRGI